MTDLKLYTKLSLLPLQQKAEVENFIDSLKFKSLKEAGKLVKRKAGKAKGLIEMKDNFDEPIAGFDKPYSRKFQSAISSSGSV